MTATVHSLPLAPLTTERIYQPRLLGRRVRNWHSGAEGRLSGEVRCDRGVFWLEVEAETGRWWWPEASVHALGPVPMPCPCPKGVA